MTTIRNSTPTVVSGEASAPAETGTFGNTQEDLLLEMAVNSQETNRARRQREMSAALGRGDVGAAMRLMQKGPLEEARENALTDLMFDHASRKTKQAEKAMKDGG
ncbi:MAG: hypothetical protein AAFU79_21915 [Myxococcota bacterium]